MSRRLLVADVEERARVKLHAAPERPRDGSLASP
jgi:hypothetical protein